MKTLLLFLLSALAIAQVRIPGPGGVAASGGGGGGPAFVSAANANQDSSASNITTTGSLTVGAGDLIVVLVAVANQSITAVTCGSNSLTSGLTWLMPSPQYAVQLWYKQNAVAGTTTCTATFNDVGTFRAIAAANYSGAATSGGILQSSVNPSGSTLYATSTNRTASNVTTTTANTILIAGGVNWDGTAGALTGANGHTVRINGVTEFLLDKFVTSTGSYPGGNFGTTASNDQYMSFYAVFGAL